MLCCGGLAHIGAKGQVSCSPHMFALHAHHRARLARMQALLELQRQADSTRISSTRELTRRPSGSQIPPLPPGGAPESSAALAAWDHQRTQSQSFTGGHLSLDLPVRWLAGFSIHAHRRLLMWPASGCFCVSWLYAKESACRIALCCSGDHAPKRMVTT